MGWRAVSAHPGHEGSEAEAEAGSAIGVPVEGAPKCSRLASDYLPPSEMLWDLESQNREP